MRKMLRVKRVGVVLGVLIVGALALAGVLSMTRGTPVKAVVVIGDKSGPPQLSDSLFTRSIELYSGLHLTNGNAAQQMLNGDGTYPRLWRDLRSAKHTITVQMYYSQPGAVADTMAAILKERAKAGVRVLFVLDAFGSQNLKRAWADSLRAAGVEIGLLRQLHWYSLHNVSDRSHVRVVVVDGEIAYTGGFGLADYWLGDGKHKGQWRETNVRFEGPAVMGLQAAFAAAWAECTGELIAGRHVLSERGFQHRGRRRDGRRVLRLADHGQHTRPSDSSRSRSPVRGRTLYVANSYFVPDDDFRKLLLDARKRGVDVRILTVSKETDVKTTLVGRPLTLRRAAQGRHSHLRISADDDALEDVHRRRHVGLDRLDELRQPVAGVQQRVELRLPRPRTRRADGLHVHGRPDALQGDHAPRFSEAPVVAPCDRERRSAAVARALG